MTDDAAARASFVVRPLRPEETDAWVAMRARLWPDADPAELRGETDAVLAGGAVLVAEVFRESAATIGGELAGFIELSLRSHAEGCESSPVGFVEGWFVEAAWRGRGVGRALVAAGEAWAMSRGCVEIASDTELSNTSSIAAHRALGFEAMAPTVNFHKRMRRSG